MRKTKVFVLQHQEGEYDSVCTVIDAVVSGPAGASMETLMAAYASYAIEYRLAQKRNWDALPRAGRKQMRYSWPKPFHDWLCDDMGFKKLDHDVWEN